MATYTTNLNLEKPATSENFNLAKINSNWDKVDTFAGTINTSLGNFKCKTIGSISANGSKTLSVANTTRAAIFVIGNNSSRVEIIILHVGPTGSAAATSVTGSTYITTDTSTSGQVTISNGTSSATDVYALIFAGSIG